MTSHDYDGAYSQTAALFGAEPEEMLVRFIRHMRADLPVLDVGCGQGRNALWLAEQGFQVVALDPSPVAIEAVRASAEQRALQIETVRGGFVDLAATRSFSGILIFGLLQILRREEIRGLLDRVRTWSSRGAIVCVSAWSDRDPSFARVCREWMKVGRNSFAHRDGRTRTYLSPGEVVRLFSTWEILHHWEGMGPVHRHGGGPTERHSRVELVAMRR